MAIVSCDIFDTAIVRTVYKPTDLFDLGGEEFKKKRIEAEQKASREVPYYNIYDIYKYLPEYDVQREINWELDNCRCNPTIMSTLMSHSLDGDEIIFISDMYLPSSVLFEMLDRCGYKAKKIFVSCEQKAHKGNGTLFNKVKKQVGEIKCHYGDNYCADILGAKIAGIAPKFVKKIEDMPTVIPELKNSKLRKLLCLNEHSDKPINDKVAFQLSTLVYSFTKWVLDCRKPGQKIIFNARDGYLPYLIAKDIFKAENIAYISCSRKSVLPCTIDFDKPIEHPDNEVHFKRLILPRTGGVKGFLESINYKPLPNEHFHKPNSDLRTFVIANQEKLYAFFQENKKNALKYLNKFGIKDGDMLVDVGYYGSIQYAIEKITKRKLLGYYVQTFESDLPIERNSYFDRPIVKYGLLIESVFSSDEDGVFGYDRKGQPIYYSDNPRKREFSKNIIDTVFKTCQIFHNALEGEINHSDVEKITVRFLYYPTLEEAEYCNEPIFENGNIKEFESCVWFDRDRILKGELQQCYDKSYWRPAFMRLLENDIELKHLAKYLRIHYD